MGDQHRIQRVEREIREVVATHLLRYHQNDLKGIVTISRVIVSGDLRNAKVYVSHIGEKLDMKENLEWLTNNAYQIQKAIGKSIAMKYTPKLKFFFDESFYGSLAMENQIREMNKPSADEATSDDPELNSDSNSLIESETTQTSQNKIEN